MRKRGYRENCVKQKPSRGYDLVLTMSAVFGVKSTKPLDPRKSMPAMLVYGTVRGEGVTISFGAKTRPSLISFLASQVGTATTTSF